jgi:hypothetical protein
MRLREFRGSRTEFDCHHFIEEEFIFPPNELTKPLVKKTVGFFACICQQKEDLQAPNVTILELAADVAELRIQLAEAQDQCIEMAVDAAELHAEIRALHEELTALRFERASWVTAMRRQPMLGAVA